MVLTKLGRTTKVVVVLGCVALMGFLLRGAYPRVYTGDSGAVLPWTRAWCSWADTGQGVHSFNITSTLHVSVTLI